MPFKNKSHSERQAATRPRIPDDRPSAARRHYDYKHQKMRRRHLRDEPLCRECKRAGYVTQAIIVDHIIPLGTPGGPGDVPSNRQSLCFPCHNAKTGRERKDKRYGPNNRSSDPVGRRSLVMAGNQVNTKEQRSGGGGVKYL